MRARRFIGVTAGVLMAAGLSLASTPSLAFSGFNTALNTKYPAAAVNSCNNCHTDAGPPDTNAYGTRINAVRSGSNLAAGTAAITAIDGEDSDGDGFINSVELTAGFNAGLASSHPTVTTTTTTTTTTTAPPTTTTTTAAPTTTTTTAAPTTTTTTAAPTTTTTTAAPTTTTTTAAPTTTTTTAAPTTTTTTAAPTTTTTTAAPTTTTTTAAPTTTTTAPTTTTTTTTQPTTTTTASTTTTTLASSGAALYNSFCASCHNGAAAGGGGRQVLGARSCSITGSINGTSVFPNGVPAMRFLQGVLSTAQIQAIANFLNSGTVTGQQRYITTCAGCHGADARGGRTGESVRGASSGDTREAIGDEREMRFLRCLPRSDLDAIGNYLRGSRDGDDDDDDDDDDDEHDD